MRVARVLAVAVFAVAMSACGLTDQPNVNTNQLLAETQEVVFGLRQELATFQDQIDSLRIELNRQDSLIRQLANLQGMPMPPRPMIDPPQ